jgi:hypothetical protein
MATLNTVSTHENGVTDRARRLGTDVQNVVGDVEGLVVESRAYLRGHLESRPYATLGVAAGVGFVLGGGLPRWVLRFFLGLAARVFWAALFSAFRTPPTATSDDNGETP